MHTHAHTHTFTRTHTLACAHTPTQLYIRAKVSVKTATVSSAEGGRNGEKKIGKGAGGLQGRGVCVWNTLNLLGLWGGSCFQNFVFPKTRECFFFSLFYFSALFDIDRSDLLLKTHASLFYWWSVHAFKKSCKFILLMKCSFVSLASVLLVAKVSTTTTKLKVIFVCQRLSFHWA